MKVVQLDDIDGRKVLQVEAPWPEIEADYRYLVSRYAEVPLPGFRPGKAPQPVIEQRFQKEIIKDLSTRIAERLGRESVRQAGVEALGPLEVSEIECKRANSFRAVVRYLPAPELRLPDLAGLKAKDAGSDTHDRISKRLLELVPFEVPSELVRRELEIDGLRESDTAGEPWHAAEERIRLMIILKKIAQQEGIDVDEHDVNKRIAEKADVWGKSEKALKSELAEGGGLVRLRDMLLAERTLEYLIELE